MNKTQEHEKGEHRIDPEKRNTVRKLMEGSVQDILNNGIISQQKCYTMMESQKVTLNKKVL